MKCENSLCIYEKNGRCLLDNIELDSQGQCEECIYLEIDGAKIRDLKEKQRRKLDKLDKVLVSSK